MKLGAYQNCLTSVYLLRTLQVLPSAGPWTGISSEIAHANLVRLHLYETATSTKPRRILLSHLLHTCLHLIVSAYEDDAQLTWDDTASLAHLLSIQLDHLVPLAERSPAMDKRYGKNHIARVFEHQLSLIAQSFGLLVVSSRLGERTVRPHISGRLCAGEHRPLPHACISTLSRRHGCSLGLHDP